MRTVLHACIPCSAFAVLLAAGAVAPETLRADTFRVTDGQNLMVMSDVSGRPTLVNAPVRFSAPLTEFDDVSGLATRPGTSELWLITDRGFLGTVNAITGKLVRKGAIASAHHLIDIAFAPGGQLYGVSSCTDQVDPATLFTISPTGTLAKVMQIGLGGNDCADYNTGALAFNAADGKMYFATVNADFHTVVDAIDLGTLHVARVFEAENSYFNATAIAFLANGRLRIVGSGIEYGEIDFSQAEVIDLGDSRTSGVLYREFVQTSGMVPATPVCLGSSTALCLFERFRVQVTYGATSTPATASLRSAGEGSFSFGALGAGDLVVRITNTCATKAKYGFSAGGPTNAKLSIQVTDVKTGVVKTYANAAGVAFAPVLAPAAFNCP